MGAGMLDIGIADTERLSQTDLRYLHIVANAGRELKTTEIATRAGEWRSSVTPALGRLAKGGYLTRRRHKERTPFHSAYVVLWSVTDKAAALGAPKNESLR